MELIVGACRRVCRAMDVASVGLVVLLAFPITYDATARAFRHPTIWVFEVSGYALIAAGFLANPAAMRSGTHFRVTLLLKLLPGWRPFLNRLSLVVTLLFAALLLGAGAYFVHYSYANHISSATLLDVPLWIPALAIPIGALGLFLETLVLLVTGREPGEGEGEGGPTEG